MGGPWRRDRCVNISGEKPKGKRDLREQLEIHKLILMFHCWNSICVHFLCIPLIKWFNFIFVDEKLRTESLSK